MSTSESAVSDPLASISAVAPSAGLHQRLVMAALEHMDSGHLLLQLPDGTVRHLGTQGPNSKCTARRNIAEHYDLGNEFYQLWLDPTMTYSSALWKSPDQTLEEAQIEKYDALCGS